MGKFEVFQDKAGEYRWRLLAANHQIVATGGEGYKDKRDCLNGISVVQRLSPTAEISDLTSAAAAQ